LIAAGSARPSRVDRWLLGSVSTDLIRDGRCSVLVVPPARSQT
jgi:nucleotide-binding universal stress UspA family protein